MGTLSSHPSSNITKLLFIGDSGTGKTGALASLVEAGFNLRVADFDAGLDILTNLLRTKDPQLLEKVNYVTLTDPVRFVNGRPIPTVKAWTQLGKILTDWPDGLGNITTWGSNDILVIDSLTFAGKACVRFVTSLQGRAGDAPQLQDYRDAQIFVENMLGAIYSPETVKCNVIVLSHVREIAKMHQETDSKGRPIRVEEAGSRKGYAETGTGQALSPNIGRYFNAILLADIEGSGLATRRLIRTVPHLNIGLKNPAPASVKPTYPIATGLADYFNAVRNGTNPNQGT